MKCKIVYVGKTRNGKPKFWCTEHHAPVLQEGEVTDSVCRFIKVVGNQNHESTLFTIDPQDYPGGIALWGAIPAVYDTTEFPLDFGIHVHARKEVGGKKVYDKTFARVAVNSPKGTVEFDSIAAVSYVFANIFNLPLDYVECNKCGFAHLDKDWFSVNAHKKHLCAGCGHEFYDTKSSVGNPIIKAKKIFGDDEVHRQVISPNRTLEIEQRDFPYGISIWGSNTAMLWTSPKTEEYGIHVHAYAIDSREPTIDETYDKVIIDGIELPVEQVRLYMVQQSLPFLEKRIEALRCPFCQEMLFETGEDGCRPQTKHICRNCNEVIHSRRRVVSNPLEETLKQLEKYAVNPRKNLDLLKAYPTLQGW